MDQLEDLRAPWVAAWNAGGVLGVCWAVRFVSRARGRAPALQLDPGDAVAHRALDDLDRRPGT